MSLPVDVAAQSTAAFIVANLPAGSAIIEVGCGDGHVALRLAQLGYDVIALDNDSDAVASARSRGVNAIAATWPQLDADTVDAVVFTRSLHHISPLDDAVAKSKELLAPSGLLLLEDFADELLATNHDHHVHSYNDMRSAIEQEFRIQSEQEVPFLYRYLIDLLPESAAATDLVIAVSTAEEHAATANNLPLVGRRLVATAANAAS